MERVTNPVGPRTAMTGDTAEAGDLQDAPVTFGLRWTDVGHRSARLAVADHTWQLAAGVHSADGAAPSLARWESSDHQAKGGRHDREAGRTISLRPRAGIQV